MADVIQNEEEVQCSTSNKSITSPSIWKMTSYTCVDIQIEININAQNVDNLLYKPKLKYKKTYAF
jgi:hypothetical protein